MTIRVVVRETDMTVSIYGGAPSASVGFKTFDIEAPELEKYLRDVKGAAYYERDVIGVELLELLDTPA